MPVGVEQWRAAVGAMARSSAPKPQSPIGPHWKKWLKASDPVAYKGCVVLLVVVGQLVWSGVEQCKEKMQEKMKEGSECVRQSASRGKTRVLAMRVRPIAVLVMSFLSQVLMLLCGHILQLHCHTLSTYSCTTGSDEWTGTPVSEEGLGSDGVWTKCFDPVRIGLMILLPPLTQLTLTIKHYWHHLLDKSSLVLSKLTTGVKKQMKCLSVCVHLLLLYVCVSVSVLKRCLQLWASVVYRKCSKKTVAEGVVWVMSVLFSGSVRTGVRIVTMIVFVNQMLLMMAGDVERNPGPDLGPDDLRTVRSELFSVRDKWYDIGLELNIPFQMLNVIEKDNPNNCSSCLRKMLMEWLSSSSPDPSWSGLVEALSSEPVGEKRLAREIHCKYCGPGNLGPADLQCVRGEIFSINHKWYDIGLELKIVFTTLDNIKANFSKADECLTEMLKHWMKNTSDPSWSGLVEALSSEPVGEKRLAREIHNKYCAAGDSINRGQMKTCVAAASAGEQGSQATEINLKSQIQSLQKDFVELRDDVYKSVKTQPVDIFKVKLLSLDANTQQHHETALIEIIRNKETVTDIWITLGSYMNFLNYDILQHVVKTFPDTALQERMQQYIRRITTFLRTTRVCDFVECWPLKGVSPPSKELRDYMSRFHKDWDTCTLQELDQLPGRLARKLLLPEFLLFLENAVRGTAPAGGQEMQTSAGTESHPAGHSNVHSCMPECFTRIKTLKDCSHYGTHFDDHCNGFGLDIPPAAIPEQECVTIDIGVALYGPFEFPEGLKPVSPVFWVCANELKFSHFLKPVTLTIPHCLDLETSGKIDSLGLTFLKGEHHDSSQKVCQFHSVEKSQVEFQARKATGTLKTRHFCSLCIAGKVTPSLIKNTKFCIYAVIPRAVGPSQVKDCCFFISYLLPTCIQTIAKQIARTEGFHNHKQIRDKFTFSPGSDDDAAIDIDLPDSTLGERNICLQGKPKICVSDIDFFTTRDVEFEEDMDIYPPRFNIVINCCTAARNCRIQFRGATSELVYDIPLNVRQSSAATPADFKKTIRRGDKVNVVALQSFSTPSQTINILRRVGTNYKPMLGNILLKSPDGGRVLTCEMTHHANVDEVVYDIFQKWCTEDDTCTWGQLVLHLRAANLNPLANDIDSVLV